MVEMQQLVQVLRVMLLRQHEVSSVRLPNNSYKLSVHSTTIYGYKHLTRAQEGLSPGRLLI